MSDRNFSWPIWMVSDTYQKSNCRVSAEQKGSEMSHQDCFIQEECATELIPVCEHNGIHVGKEVLGNLSSLRWMAPACTQAVSNVFPAYTLNAVGIAENVLHHLSCSSGIAMTDSDSAYNQSAEVERNHGGFMKSNHTSDENGSAPVENTVNTHDLVSAVEEQTGLQSRILPSNDPHSFFAGSEIEHVYVPTEDDSSSNKKDQKQELHQESNSCFLSSEITSQKETSRLVEGGLVNDQTCQELRQKLSLEELISSAISAECQIQKASSHYDLQRLSQLLTEQMISIYGKEKSSSILLSDLVHACAADTNVAAQRITLQRYFAALLNATHQHNLRLLKHSKNMEGCQILLQENESEKLSDVKIRLLSLKD
ncbi:hypothetical protein KP509_05G092900 [Ceratopteris richardii]|uniref:Uncharacterized protein n=1 Tax=Ceratopteris richardii TaxID=49495 RepID=A0A8T2UR98_CERRI|nr:hypothetical protein KP509_05G092900 [Ceratopteris richardii]